MSDWTDGYVADIGYTHGFYRELTPALLAFAMTLRGADPQWPTSSFRYCELGSGQGFTTNLLAAANPNGEFWAVDFNPQHAAGAQRLAANAGSANVQFRDQSFQEFLEEDTPQFDFICLHGVYSWISRENRDVIVEIIRRKLRFGGTVYISYNALPGWSAVMPMRQLMIEHAASSSEPTVTKINKAVEFAKTLRDQSAAYFTNNPGVGPRLDRIVQMSRNYLAHEYFNRDWNPQYFAEVARELAASKLSFVGSAHFGDHLDMLNLTEEAQKTLAAIDDAMFRETVRDYFVNQQFRRDIFAKGVLRLAATEQQAKLLGFRFTLLTPSKNISLKATFTVGEVTLQEQVYGPVLSRLAQGPATLAEMLEDGALQALGFPKLLQAMTVLCAMGHAAPCVTPAAETAAKPTTEQFNATVLERAQFVDELHALASPVTGSGVSVDRFNRLFLLARRRGESDLAAFAWSVLKSHNERLLKDGKALESDEENLQELRSRQQQFETEYAPVYEFLGIH
jgi:SAM-dependent methyltransferase